MPARTSPTLHSPSPPTASIVATSTVRVKAMVHVGWRKVICISTRQLGIACAAQVHLVLGLQPVAVVSLGSVALLICAHTNLLREI